MTDPTSTLIDCPFCGGEDTAFINAYVLALTGESSSVCQHEPFEGKCIHCNAPFLNGVARPKEYIPFKSGDTHCEDCPCRYGRHLREPKREAQEETYGNAQVIYDRWITQVPSEQESVCALAHKCYAAGFNEGAETAQPKREVVDPVLLNIVKEIASDDQGRSSPALQEQAKELLSTIEGGES